MPASSLKALDTVFVTHLHSDHLIELGPLPAHRVDRWAHASSVSVLNGPAGTGHYWDRFLPGDGVRH